VSSTNNNYRQQLKRSGTSLSIPPGYYSLEIPLTSSASPSIEVRNLKLDENILHKSNGGLLAASPAERIPFAIFPIRLNRQFRLFTRLQPDVSPNQHVEFRWRGIKDGITVTEIKPSLEMVNVELKDVQRKWKQILPYLLFNKEETLILKCTLLNGSQSTAAGNVEAFLSEIGESQPWKAYAASSSTQEFVLEPNQSISIDIPIGTNELTGDYQLSYWIFTRADLPFSPQNGGWFNKQIRIQDPHLGIHPIYRTPIP
jgi:hypothetical protein